MQKKNNSEIKEKIISEIRKTEKRIAEFKELTKPTAPDCAIGRVSRMDAINNNNLNSDIRFISQKNKSALDLN